MDAYEATRIVFSRIQSLDPENASKIMGLLLIQDHGEKEMIRLAFGPESLLHSMILKARSDLRISSNTSSAPPTPSSPTPSPFLSSRHLGGGGGVRGGITPPPPLTIPSPPLSSWDSSVFSDFQNPDDFLSPSNPSSSGPFRAQPMNGISKPLVGSISSPMNSSSPFATDLMDELHFQDQGLFSPYGGDAALYPPYGGDGGAWSSLPHRRSCSVSDICIGSGVDDLSPGFGWKPCLYFARGYCKNGTSCRFLHGGDSDSVGPPGSGSPGNRFDMMEQCELLRTKSAQQQRLAAAAAQLMGNSFPYSPGKCINYDAQRAMMMGEDMHKFGRSRLECSAGMVTPSSRQIYLTFPADSTFREEDVSNYFSIYGPVQDVRIPYQQKRMFGFVTFVYPDTVKLILAKGNPHFVCDARVLVKPYKEKGKVPDKFRKQQQQMERMEFSSPCSTPTGLDSRDPLDLQLGARGFYNGQDMLWRRKLEEQSDLQQALELQGRRLMGLQLLDAKKPFHNPNIGSPLKSPSDHSSSIFSAQSRLLPAECITAPQENGSIPASMGTETDSTGSSQNGNVKESPISREDSAPQESFEHNLPDSPFASPKKVAARGESASAFAEAAVGTETNKPVASSDSMTNDPNIASSLLLASSTLDIASFKSCYFPMPRFPPSQETIGM